MTSWEVLMWYLCCMSVTSSLRQMLAVCKTSFYESLTSQRFMGNCKLISCSILKQLCWIGHRSGTGIVIKFPHNCIGQIVRELQFDAVLRIRDILVRIQIQIRGSVPLTNGSVFFCYYFLKLYLHHFSKIKSLKEVTKQ